MSKHTPGPWRSFYEGGGDYCVISEVGAEIASVSRPDAHFMATGPGADINEANARLIAAAPELLEALRGLDEAYCRAGNDLTRDERHEDRMRLIAARAAIAKATGEQA